MNELGSTVTAFSYQAERGAFREIGTVSTLPKDFSGENDTAEIAVHSSGKFLYASNRGHDSIAVFAIDSAKGTLTPTAYVSTGGKTPRNFAIDPTGEYLLAANQNSDGIVVFRIDRKTGGLSFTGLMWSDWLRAVYAVFGAGAGGDRRLDVEFARDAAGYVLLQVRPALFSVVRNPTLTQANSRETCGDLPRLRTASRKLHELETSTLLTLLQAFVIGEVGTGSSKRLGKNVGSGIGISIEGATSP